MTLNHNNMRCWFISKNCYNYSCSTSIVQYVCIDISVRTIYKQSKYLIRELLNETVVVTRIYGKWHIEGKTSLETKLLVNYVLSAVFVYYMLLHIVLCKRP